MEQDKTGVLETKVRVSKGRATFPLKLVCSLYTGSYKYMSKHQESIAMNNNNDQGRGRWKGKTLVDLIYGGGFMNFFLVFGSCSI